MKILLTGASSFTGYWFTKELIEAGHEVIAPLLRPREAYSGLRLSRVQGIEEHALFDCPFGSERFIKLIEDQGPFDLLCHHAADVTNYRSPTFDVKAAVANNTRNLAQVMEGCERVVLTGSVFEPGEGAGSSEAVSPYGLSKGLTSQVFLETTQTKKIKMGKFVISNPFGPFEEERYTTSLIKTWVSGSTAKVKYPDYIRDNIHVSLLAKAYRQFVETLTPEPGYVKINPSGYVESQGAFTKRFATEIGSRLDLPCRFTSETQIDFPEPKERYNTDRVAVDWDETDAWDTLADFYQRTYGA